MNAPDSPDASAPRQLREGIPQTHRQRLYRLAEVYDRCVIRAWTTRDIAGMENEHRTALQQLEDARRRMDRASRGFP